MITFKTFLESEDAPDFDQYVTENCAPFLEELGIDDDFKLASKLLKLPLYRGLNTESGKAVKISDAPGCFIKKVRADRTPMTTSMQISDLMDDFFDDKFGWKPRLTSVFCWGKDGMDDAADYGEVYQIIPIGGFKYIWTECSDLTVQVSKIISTVGLSDNEALNNGEYSDNELSLIKKAFEKTMETNSHDTNLREAILATPMREIMIQCDSYLCVPIK